MQNVKKLGILAFFLFCAITYLLIPYEAFADSNDSVGVTATVDQILHIWLTTDTPGDSPDLLVVPFTPSGNLLKNEGDAYINNAGYVHVRTNCAWRVWVKLTEDGFPEGVDLLIAYDGQFMPGNWGDFKELSLADGLGQVLYYSNQPGESYTNFNLWVDGLSLQVPPSPPLAPYLDTVLFTLDAQPPPPPNQQ